MDPVNRFNAKFIRRKFLKEESAGIVPWIKFSKNPKDCTNVKSFSSSGIVPTKLFDASENVLKWRVRTRRNILEKKIIFDNFLFLEVI